MKKLSILLLILFTVSTSFCFGQSKRPLEEFGPWIQDPCFKGISYKGRKEYYNESSKGYKWDVIFKNNYSVRVAFTWAMAGTDEDVDAGHGSGRHTFMPGDEITCFTIVPDAKSGDGGLKIKTDRVCFDFELLGSSWIDKCGGDVMVQFHSSISPYADCDNGKPNQPKNPNAEKEKDNNAVINKGYKEEIKSLTEQPSNRKTGKANEGNNNNALDKVDKERLNSSKEQTESKKTIDKSYLIGEWSLSSTSIFKQGKETPVFITKSVIEYLPSGQGFQKDNYGTYPFTWSISDNIFTIFTKAEFKTEILRLDKTNFVFKAFINADEYEISTLNRLPSGASPVTNMKEPGAMTQQCKTLEQIIVGTKIPADASLTASLETVMFMTKTAIEMIDAGCPGSSESMRKDKLAAYKAAEDACNQVQSGGRRCVAFNHYPPKTTK